MKKISSVLLLLLLCVCFTLTGCSSLSMPTGYETVTSNGGFIVGAGDYVYFANAYKNYSSLTKKSDNSGNGVAQFALNRLELDGDVQKTGFWFKADEDESVNFELVVNKIAGYETANMYIVGEYLYFTTPNVHKNKSNEYEFNLSTLFRIKLDGTGLKEILTTKSEGAKFYLTGGENKQILIYDDNTIKCIDVYKNSTSVKAILDDEYEVTNVIFPNADEEVVENLYFTTDRGDSYTGNILYKLNLQSGDVEKKLAVPYETVTLIAYDRGILFYTRTGKATTEGLYSTARSEAHAYMTDITKLMYVKCENAENNCFVFVYNNNLYVKNMSSGTEVNAVKLNSETSELQFVSGQYVYYSTSTGIYRISVLDRTEQQISDITNFNDDMLDFDGRFVYFFAQRDGQETNTDYLYRADVIHMSSTGEIKTECVAKLLDEDIEED